MRHLASLLALACLASCAATDAPSERRLLTARAYIETDYASVWHHLTSAEAFEPWYTSPCRTFSTSPGDELVWAVDDRVIYEGRLLWIEEGTGISWEFRFVDFGFEEAMTPVVVHVTDCGPTILVSIEHDVTGAPETEAMISPVGWTKPLSRLKTLLETGEAMPWPEDASTRTAAVSGSAR